MIKDPELTEDQLTDILTDLPELISEPVYAFSYYSERLIATFGAITVAGALMTNLTGLYHRRRAYSSLYLAIVAGPSSNKGVITYLRKLAEKVHLHYRVKSDADLQKYVDDQRVYSQSLKKGGQGNMPLHPPYKVTLISGDITAPKLIEQLHSNRNGVPSIVVEDEIDSLAVAGSGEHGKALSRIYRNCYHHATITQQLKTGNQHYEISNPVLAMLIAGTPKQMSTLIGSIENGLYSRFAILIIDDGATWQSVAPCENCFDRDKKFEELSDTYFEMWEYLAEREVEVCLTSAQWDAINQFGAAQLGYQYNLTNEALAAVVKRHCLMLFKFCMTLTGLRYWESRGNNAVAFCSQTDFDIAMRLVQHSLHCSIAYFKHLPGGANSGTAKRKEQLLKGLCNTFTRIEAIEVGKKLKLSERQTDRYLQHFVQSDLLVKTGQGAYEKQPMAERQNDDNEDAL